MAMKSSGDHPIINVSGTRLALGAVRHDLIDIYLRWINDVSVSRTLNWPRQITRPVLVQSIESQEVDQSQEWFTIYEIGTWRPIGVAGLTDIDFRNRTAEFSIAIGEDDARGKGGGTEATRLMLDHAFTVLSLRNVMLKVYEYNLAGARAYAKAGFREFGRRRQAIEMNGRNWDVIYMECLRDEFESPVLGSIMAPDQPR
jgi:diamine N-acetyltransferase